MLVALGGIFGGNNLYSQVPPAGAQVPAQAQAASRPAPRKRALLVGVSDYCRDNSGRECRARGKFWWDLNSGNDVDAIKAVLMSDQFGFKEDEIKVLKTKAETTRDSIVGAFKSFLTGQTGPGDIVYFHYSGHGGQVEDDANPRHGRNPKVGDELDGLDETLIPSDYAAQGDGSKDIRDDELEELIAGLSGRQVTVTADSCFSGTITRNGRRLVRGIKISRAVAANPLGRKDGPSGIFPQSATLPASLVVISAARNDQLASETSDESTGKEMGAFSYSLVRALGWAGRETTYRDIFEKVNGEITRRSDDQNPQLEGSRDNVLFSGVVRPPQPYINLAVADSKVMLKAGSLQGMTTGSRFSIYPAGKDSKPGSPMAQAEITAVGPTASVLKLTPEPDEKALEELGAARAVETTHNFGDVRLKVIIDNATRALLGEERMRVLKGLALLNVTGDADWNVQVCRGRCDNEKPPAGSEPPPSAGVLTLIREDGSIIERVPEGPQMLDGVKGALEGEARWRFVKTLRNESDPNLRIKMRLVPVTNVEQDPNTKLARSARDVAAEVPLAEGGQMVLHDGDTVMLEVMNLGTEEPYVSVLDLRSTGEIGPLFPHPLVPPGNNENRIRVRNDREGRPVWQRIPIPFVIKIGKPYGREVFKAIVTRGEADFSPLFRPGDAGEIQRGQRRGTTRGQREAKSPLGQILLTATTGLTRGQTRGRDGETGLYGAEDAAKIGAPAEDWSTAEITFEARPPRPGAQPPQTLSAPAVAAQDEKEIRPLELHKAVERELAGGQSHSYLITLAAGQYLGVVADQRGIDVVVTLFGPDGKQLVEVDSPNGEQGPEPLSATAATSGVYRLRVTSLEKDAAAGRYEVKIEELRTATPQDESRFAAERAFAEAEQLRGRRTAEARRSAVEKYEEALTLFRAVGDRAREARTLGTIGVTYNSLAELRKALPYFEQALHLFREVGDKDGEVQMLNNIGVLNSTFGEKQKAIQYYEQALPIQRALNDKYGESVTRHNIGKVYWDLGDSQRALQYYEQALPLRREVGEKRGEALTLTGIGTVYWVRSEWQKALQYFDQALLLTKQTDDKVSEAAVLYNIGGVYRDLGEQREALKYYGQALALQQASNDRYGAALTLIGIGLAHQYLGNGQEALRSYEQALPHFEAFGDRNREAATLTNIGTVYLDSGEQRKALQYFEQALPLLRAVGDKFAEGITLNNVGVSYQYLGERQKALRYFQQSLILSRSVRDRRGEARTLSNLMVLCSELQNPELAIFFGKQSVKAYQALRSNIRTLDRPVQYTFLRTVVAPYRQLADLLLSRNRLSEAHQIIDRFRDREFYDYSSGQDVPAGVANAASSEIELTGRERRAELRLQTALGRVESAASPPNAQEREVLGRELARAEPQGKQDPEADLKHEVDSLQALLREFDVEFKRPAGNAEDIQTTDTTEMQRTLRELKQLSRQQVVAIYTLVGKVGFHALLITPDRITSASVGVKGDELNEKALQLWGLLQSANYDPSLISGELYNVIFKPVEGKLPKDTQTIMWSLDGNLRYVPMAALYDGRRYLAERYNHVIFTRADRERLTRAPTRQWTGVGMGSSKGHMVELLGTRMSFDALPGVGEELRAVFRADGNTEGVIDGEVLPDERFTKTSMLAALARRRPVVHIASHFTFRPGDDTRSFLLLGDGSVMTLAEMKLQRELFAGVELLTLSACNTAAQQPDADGREIDAFAEMAQRLGAASVMATLWPLADDSSPWLMREFYRTRQLAGGMVKAEALRRAQLALLNGSARTDRPPKARQEPHGPAIVVVTADGGKRREGGTRADVIYVAAKEAPPYRRNHEKPYAHPYYWAPFILIGNWR
jgi:CHAT domain-containing protein/tetratricopeptide (TPR) repeat protein